MEMLLPVNPVKEHERGFYLTNQEIMLRFSEIMVKSGNQFSEYRIIFCNYRESELQAGFIDWDVA